MDRITEAEVDKFRRVHGAGAHLWEGEWERLLFSAAEANRLAAALQVAATMTDDKLRAENDRLAAELDSLANGTLASRDAEIKRLASELETANAALDDDEAAHSDSVRLWQHLEAERDRLASENSRLKDDLTVALKDSELAADLEEKVQRLLRIIGKLLPLAKLVAISEEGAATIAEASAALFSSKPTNSTGGAAADLG